MTCEDYEGNGEHLLAKGARRLSLLIGSPPFLRVIGHLPENLRRALATVLLAVANALKS